MPHLQFDLDFEVTAREADRFASEMAELYAERMDADTDYAAVSVREVRAIHLGRATGDKTVVLQADIRAGRSAERKRDLALAVIEAVAERFGVPESNQKVVFTEHEGSQMMGYDRVGDDWSESA
ncbi:tautomerase family protein [Haloferax denitrificans]|uniref:Tautomerase n=1 Tax=Haloferax denitrificans ATCC 35960 TaxID=662478 RepID=M0J7G1_9EURY|nr:tautomerase family protein [Haloferax denitrificans]EMA04906.1 tautomerase [Haloferax denitrificans ATCC 35960]